MDHVLLAGISKEISSKKVEEALSLIRAFPCVESVSRLFPEAPNDNLDFARVFQIAVKKEGNCDPVIRKIGNIAGVTYVEYSPERKLQIG